MDDLIRRLTAELATDPSSLAFVELGEALRRRGQYAAAAKVARGGLRRYPELVEGHDLLARTLADQGERTAAREAWERVLALSPGHVGAHKGLAFLSARAGAHSEAIAHLERALAAAPDDAGVRAALDRLRGVPAGASAPAPAAEAPPPAARTVLLDAQGLRVAGDFLLPDGTSAGDAVAAELAGVSREAARAVRLLQLGAWQHLSAESPDGTMLLLAPTPSTALFLVRDPDVPVGRVALEAEQTARSAREWLERLA
ncbi:MAG: tetratricopeptide repeat protein [Gemmatimonadales bacterium]|jgi:tetratricopeptide (TPR) repeat protein|nr:tetratricopeptide repeat protein [Gemmatimonadales bacterium]